jgi:hypothetical protein
MRGVRSLIALVVVFGGLLAYLYFVDAKKPVTPEGVETRDKVFSVESDKIEELRITSSSGDTTTLKKEKDSWQMLSPIKAKVDESEVSGITSNLSTLEIQSVVDENPSDVHPYGLKEPRIEVAFKSGGDKEFKGVRLGSKTPTGGDIYAQRLNEKQVFLVPAYLESTFDRKPFDLREKNLLAFDRDKVDRLELAFDKTKIELAKSGTDWRIVSPIQAAADFSAVEGLVTRLQSAQMKSLVEENAGELKQYGLADPAATATVGAGSTRATLAFGKTAEGTDVYARDVSRMLVATVGDDLLKDVRKTVADLRRKDVFEFRSYSASRVEVTRGAETFVFEKVKGTGSDAAEKWRRVQPSAGDVDQAKMESFLSALTGLRAQSFADPKAPTGLDSPVAVVTAKYDEGKKEERVRFGRAGDDAFAARGDETGAARLDKAAFDEAMKALDALK